MSNKKPKKKKTVVTTQKKLKPTASRKVQTTTTVNRELTFDRDNYMWMGIGAGLVALGLIMMLGGSMPSPDVWDPSIIYSARITILGPILILAGLIVEIYAIFK